MGLEQIDTLDSLEQTHRPADEKTAMLQELSRLVSRVPPSVCNGSVQLVRAWRADCEYSVKAASSRQFNKAKIGLAINRLKRYWGEL